MHTLHCYRCGGSLSKYSLPLSRRDQCPECGVDLHVCLMCTHYDPRVPQACDEEDALEVLQKAQANFCDYFEPNEQAFAPGRLSAHEQAQQQLDALFGGPDSTPEPEDPATERAGGDDAARRGAAALFKK